MVSTDFIDFFHCSEIFLEIRLFEEKGYGFIKFQTHEAATQAICEMTGVTVNGCQVSFFIELNF